FIPGGLIGRAERAFGPRIASLATAGVITERLLLVAIACVLCGQYAVSFGAAWMAQWSVTARLTVQELVVVGATVLIGLLWARSRLAFSLPAAAIARAVWFGVGIIGALIVFGFATLLRHDASIITLVRSLPGTVESNTNLFNKALWLVAGF